MGEDIYLPHAGLQVQLWAALAPNQTTLTKGENTVTCEMRHTYTNGFPYTCGLPADLVTIAGGIAVVQARLCHECQQLVDNAGFVVIVNPQPPTNKIEERDYVN